jgi:hypothetical protein
MPASNASRSHGADDASVIEINRKQRDVLWEDAVITLSGVGDLANTPKWANLDHHLHTRRRMAAAMWLLDDLGWLADDPRERFYLTMPITTLRWWLRELDDYALDSLRDVGDVLADPVKNFHYNIELGDETLEDCIAEARRSCDEHLEIRSVCRDLLAKVA